MAKRIDTRPEQEKQFAKFVGKRVRFAREMRAMSMRELRVAMNLRSDAAISEYESGRTVPSLNALMLMGKALNVRPGWFLGELMPEEKGATNSISFDAPFSGMPMNYAGTVYIKNIPEKPGHSRGVPGREQRQNEMKEKIAARLKADAIATSEEATRLREELAMLNKIAAKAAGASKTAGVIKTAGVSKTPVASKSAGLKGINDLKNLQDQKEIEELDDIVANTKPKRTKKP